MFLQNMEMGVWRKLKVSEWEGWPGVRTRVFSFLLEAPMDE